MGKKATLLESRLLITGNVSSQSVKRIHWIDSGERSI